MAEVNNSTEAMTIYGNAQYDDVYEVTGDPRTVAVCAAGGWAVSEVIGQAGPDSVDNTAASPVS